MVDIIGIGWKLMQNVKKIDRVAELSRPIIDKATADPTLLPTLKESYALYNTAHDQYLVARAKVKPILDEFDKVALELVPLVLDLAKIFTPSAPEPLVPRRDEVGYGVKWIQQTLVKDLGKRALPRYGVDGDYREETRDAVRVFQRKYKEECGADDGWVGPKTAAVMERINPPFVPDR